MSCSRCEFRSIQVNERGLDDVVEDTWRAVLASDPPAVFVRAGRAVRLRRFDSGVVVSEPLNFVGMFGVLVRVADWVRRTRRGLVPARPPAMVVRAMLDRPAAALPFVPAMSAPEPGWRRSKFWRSVGPVDMDAIRWTSRWTWSCDVHRDKSCERGDLRRSGGHGGHRFPPTLGIAETENVCGDVPALGRDRDHVHRCPPCPPDRGGAAPSVADEQGRPHAADRRSAGTASTTPAAAEAAR
jgi:hypothetical protein